MNKEWLSLKKKKHIYIHLLADAAITLKADCEEKNCLWYKANRQWIPKWWHPLLKLTTLHSEWALELVNNQHLCLMCTGTPCIVQLDHSSVLFERELAFFYPCWLEGDLRPCVTVADKSFQPPQLDQGRQNGPFPWQICNREVCFSSNTELTQLCCDWILENISSSPLPVSFLWLLDSGKHCRHLPMQPLSILLLPHKTYP